MADLRDRLLALDRDGLEKEAAQLGIAASESMSRAELITSIEKHFAQKEFGEIRSFKEYGVLITGLLLVTSATVVLAVDTYFQLQGVYNFTVITAPVYLVCRAVGGLLIAAALISLSFKRGYQSITPVVRAALVVGAVLVIIIVIVSVPLPFQWQSVIP